MTTKSFTIDIMNNAERMESMLLRISRLNGINLYRSGWWLPNQKEPVIEFGKRYYVARPAHHAERYEHALSIGETFKARNGLILVPVIIDQYYGPIREPIYNSNFNVVVGIDVIPHLKDDIHSPWLARSMLVDALYDTLSMTPSTLDELIERTLRRHFGSEFCDANQEFISMMLKMMPEYINDFCVLIDRTLDGRKDMVYSVRPMNSQHTSFLVSELGSIHAVRHEEYMKLNATDKVLHHVDKMEALLAALPEQANPGSIAILLLDIRAQLNADTSKTTVVGDDQSGNNDQKAASNHVSRDAKELERRISKTLYTQMLPTKSAKRKKD